MNARPVLFLMLLALSSSRAAEPEVKKAPEPAAAPERFTPEQRDHWAYKPPVRPELPEVKESSWVINPIDRFILAGLESVEFRHAAEADRVALIRRATFDLTGLPPSPREVADFVGDTRPDAYERLVDRLLASPAYGERWAQHWLDLAHYADSNGFELDAERPDAWRYRDWVVSALNNDLPYDRFLTLQLAGDEVAPDDTSALIATGFGRCGPREVVGGNLDPKVVRQSELSEITGTVGSVFLGLTIACAKCHDHKFDPLPTTDYYRLQSFFAGAELVEKPTASKADLDAFEAAKKTLAEKTAPLRNRMAEIEAPYRKALIDQRTAMLTATERQVMSIPDKDRTPAQKRLAAGLMITLRLTWEVVAEAVSKNPDHHAERERLKREIYALETSLPPAPAHALALLEDKPEAPETYVARRGDPRTLGARVEPRPPGILLASQTQSTFDPDSITPTKTTSGRRAALAHWLADPGNPITPRVIVNRLWQHHFGRGIVATTSDFGVRGEEPSHLELLDWLATELIGQGWHLKPIHRLMVTSAAYRQASTSVHSQAVDDPQNTLFSYMNRRRLEAESLRDALLFVSGDFNSKAGGPGVKVPIEREVEDLIFTEAEVVDLWAETPDPAEHLRRSLYLFRKRNVRYPMFDAFDAPDTQSACPQRGVSTHALQALVLLNGDFSTARARAFAGRLYREACDTDSRVVHAYRCVLSRDPRPDELAQARSFLSTQAEFLRSATGRPLAKPTFCPPGVDPSEAAALVDFSLAMLNRNEFLYIP